MALQSSVLCFNWISCRRGFNSLWLNDAIWRYRSGSTLAQVMACCLREPNHYLNQCWLIVKYVRWHSAESNFVRSVPELILDMCLEITLLKLLPHLPGANELTFSLPQGVGNCIWIGPIYFLEETVTSKSHPCCKVSVLDWNWANCGSVLAVYENFTGNSTNFELIPPIGSLVPGRPITSQRIELLTRFHLCFVVY